VGKTLVVGPACVLARRGADADVPLTLSPESDLEWWFFHNSFLELIPPPTPASTIYATERLRTAQDLLHQLDSIRQQAAILTNKGFSRCELHHALEHVMAGEIESQTTKSK
jgi:hypothetical protein